MTAKVTAAAAFTVILAACTAATSPPGPSAPPGARPIAGAVGQYRCDQDIAFTVRFSDGAAVIDAGPRGTETLLRDAGGITPQQTVYSSTRMRAEFGLEPAGRGARLNFLSSALEASCVRE